MQQVAWITLNDLESKLKVDKASFTPWFEKAWQVVKRDLSLVENLFDKKKV